MPEADLDVVSASPEAFLLLDGDTVESRPIKGTATSRAAMLAKDYAENVMIVDLVRNDLHHVCRAGTVRVDHLCAPEEHPGWCTSSRRSPGSCARAWGGTRSSRAPSPRLCLGRAQVERPAGHRRPRAVTARPYCGAVGWVDADRGRAELAVGIRTFWAEHDSAGSRWLRFGTGAGITWGSDAQAEWEETQLKAARLIGLASGRVRA